MRLRLLWWCLVGALVDALERRLEVIGDHAALERLRLEQQLEP